MSSLGQNKASTTASSQSADVKGKGKVTRRRWRKKYNTGPWTIKENYDLVIAVNSFSGEAINWPQVSIKLIALNNENSPRSKEWYSPPRCAEQYELALQEYGTIFPEVVYEEPRLSRAVRFLTAEHGRLQRAELACDEAEIKKIKKDLADLEAGLNDDILDEWEAEFMAELKSMCAEDLVDDGTPAPKKSIMEEILDQGIENPDAVIARLTALWEEDMKCSYKDFCAEMGVGSPTKSALSVGVGDTSGKIQTEAKAIKEEIGALEKGLKPATQGEILKVPVAIERKNEKVVQNPGAKAGKDINVDKKESVDPTVKDKDGKKSLKDSSAVPLDTKPNTTAADTGIRQEKGTKVVEQAQIDKDAGRKSRSEGKELEKTEKNTAVDVGLKEGNANQTVDKSLDLKESDAKTEQESSETSKRTRKSRKSQAPVPATERRSSSRIQPVQTGNSGRDKDRAKISESESFDASAHEENKDKDGPIPTTVNEAPDNLKLSEIKIEINDEQFSRSTCSSPAFSDTNVKVEDEQKKVFKKSILFLHQRIRGHKNASLFHKPIKEENAPGYHRMILEPMDLSKIKKRIESGQINSIDDYERDITVMLLNATMFNSSKSDISILTQEMAKDVWDLIEDYRTTQQLVLQQSTPQDSESGEQPSPVYPIRRTRRRDSSMTIPKPETIVQKLKKSSGRLTPGTSPRKRGTSASESVDSAEDPPSLNKNESVTETEGSKSSTLRKRTGSVSDKEKDKGQGHGHGRIFRNRSGSGNEVTMPTLGDTSAVIEHSEGTETEKMSKRKRKTSIVPVVPVTEQEIKIEHIPEGEGEASTSKSGLKPGQTRKSRRAI